VQTQYLTSIHEIKASLTRIHMTPTLAQQFAESLIGVEIEFKNNQPKWNTSKSLSLYIKWWFL